MMRIQAQYSAILAAAEYVWLFSLDSLAVNDESVSVPFVIG